MGNEDVAAAWGREEAAVPPCSGPGRIPWCMAGPQAVVPASLTGCCQVAIADIASECKALGRRVTNSGCRTVRCSRSGIADATKGVDRAACGGGRCTPASGRCVGTTDPQIRHTSLGQLETELCCGTDDRP
jgi:hypothetical protein